MNRSKFKIDWTTSIAASLIATLLISAVIYAPVLIVLILVGGCLWWLLRRNAIPSLQSLIKRQRQPHNRCFTSRISRKKRRSTHHNRISPRR